MTSPAPRRKGVRLRLRADLDFIPQKFEGRSHYVAKDPVRLRYFRLPEREYFLLRQLDGTRTLGEVQRAFEHQYRPERLKLESVEAFAQRALQDGLVHCESPEAGRQLWTKHGRETRGRWLRTLGNLLYVKIPLFDPDRLLNGLVPLCGWIFRGWFVTLGLGLMLAALLLVTLHFDAFREKLANYRDFFGLEFALCIWLALGAVKVIHELGHGLCCKVHGGEVHELGLLFLCLSPCCYCNVSDSWRLPSKWRRIAVSCAGIYVELLLASLATFVWWHTPGHAFLHALSLSLMIVCGAGTLLFNANPLLRYDGYYVLADWMEVPNLKTFANRLVKYHVLRDCLGVAVKPLRAMPPARKLLLLTYAIVSYLYGWVLTYGILWFVYRLLKTYRLGAVGAALAAGVTTLALARPLYRLAGGIHHRGRLPDMNPKRVCASAAVAATLGLFVFLAPLPIGHIRETALVQLPPENVEQVFPASSGTLERVYVRDGQRVEKGELLAELHSLELENQREEARSQHDIRAVNAQALREWASLSHDPAQRAQIDVSLARARRERELFARHMHVYDGMLRKLEVRAPRAGIVMAAPRRETLGKFWDREQAGPLCKIGGGDTPRALVPLTPADYRLLKDLLRRDPKPAVSIRLPGRDTQTWKGKVTRLSDAEVDHIPLQLTTKGGGSVPAGNRTDKVTPMTQHYFATIDFLEWDSAIYPGAMAHIKIPCTWRTCAWWLWHTIARTFDIGLL